MAVDILFKLSSNRCDKRCGQHHQHLKPSEKITWCKSCALGELFLSSLLENNIPTLFHLSKQPSLFGGPSQTWVALMLQSRIRPHHDLQVPTVPSRRKLHRFHLSRGSSLFVAVSLFVSLGGITPGSPKKWRGYLAGVSKKNIGIWMDLCNVYKQRGNC